MGRRELAAKGLRLGSMVAAAVVTRRLAEMTWKKATGEDPPTDPDDLTTSWPQALAWAVIAGSLASIARVVARRGAKAVTAA